MHVRKKIPRLPLEGNLDLTYRCNNTCRHCWLWLHSDAPQGQEELSLAEIRVIVDEARAMGCRTWAISGGEPMLRPDFAEIFDYLTHKAISYSLNTNGTLITPEIAQLMRRNGKNMVALYGATAEVHDHVTRNPGSFEATMRGFAYLREAGGSFIVQIVPMRANYHQYQQMIELAKTLGPHYRLGAAWLNLSACRSEARNHQIAQQRLDPAIITALNDPVPLEESLEQVTDIGTIPGADPGGVVRTDDRLFADCIAGRRDFHIDPYGQISFCSYVKDPALRYDLRRGSFRQAWDEFIPSLVDVIHGGQEYRDNCGSCDLRRECRWCAVYAYLEHGRYSAKVDYLCQVAAQTHQYRENWKLAHVRYFQIAGITIQVAVDFQIKENTFPPSIRAFEVDGPGNDNISLRHISSIPPRSAMRVGKKVYHQDPWEIYKQRDAWIYMGSTSDDENVDPNLLAIFNQDHTQGTIFRHKDFYKNGLGSLTTFPTDQILLARILADRQGFILHASGITLDGDGLLFVGHSGAGKSTMLKMLRAQGEILCDDRIALRRWSDGFRIHGTWSHGELPDVSPASAPLRAILYLEQAPANELIPLADTRERLGRMLSHVIKPLVTADWWEKTLDLAGQVAAGVPAYRLRFDKSGQVVGLLRDL